MGTTQQTGPIDNRHLSAGEIVGIVFGVFVVVSVVSSVIFFWKRRREMHRNIGNRNAGSNEDVPLINPFLEEPNDIHCIEGEDAILTCKLRPDIPPVKWLKNGREFTQNEKYIISKEDTQHKFTIKNTTESDSGDYSVQVGIFSKKIQLNITGI
ncbi:immunoglobulin superfamily member 22-like [Mytilus galloprovincialis]|uniref:immunoglobulin superfamily member 22-like n=1 Tax=Mytilus galloprovincialis TaxID=29158 RepID=UPI003F7BA88B